MIAINKSRQKSRGPKKELHILLRTGTVEGDLLERVSDFGYVFKRLPSPPDFEEWYAFYLPRKKQLFTLSRIHEPVTISNSLVSIASYSYDKNIKLLEKFEQKTGITMEREPGKFLAYRENLVLPLLFPIIEKYGDKIFDNLKQMFPQFYG
ncbi:MAG: hypothetical protein ABIH37_04750 [archaeon]